VDSSYMVRSRIIPCPLKDERNNYILFKGMILIIQFPPFQGEG